MNKLYVEIDNIKDAISELEKRLKLNIQTIQKQIEEIKTIIDTLNPTP